MTLPASGPIAVSDVSVEIGQASTYSASLGFLNGLILPAQKPAAPNMGAFYGLTYFQRNTAGNCNNANCGSSGNCGNIECTNCYGSQCVNCTNCDSQQWLQTNCNCACTYNCNSNQVSYNCNCSKIICTKLHEFNLMSSVIYQADQEFGAELAKTRPDIYNGYRAWANIVVEWMEGNGPNMMPWLPEARRREITHLWSTKWAYDIATPWAEYMAYKMGKTTESNLTGKMLMVAGIPICKAVGVWRRWFGPSKKPAGFVIGLMLIMVFIVFKSVAELGRAIEYFKIKRLTV